MIFELLFLTYLNACTICLEAFRIYLHFYLNHIRLLTCTSCRILQQNLINPLLSLTVKHVGLQCTYELIKISLNNEKNSFFCFFKHDNSRNIDLSLILFSISLSLSVVFPLKKENLFRFVPLQFLVQRKHRRINSPLHEPLLCLRVRILRNSFALNGEGDVIRSHGCVPTWGTNHAKP